jgi:hypothetical protein
VDREDKITFTERASLQNTRNAVGKLTGEGLAANNGKNASQEVTSEGKHEEESK